MKFLRLFSLNKLTNPAKTQVENTKPFKSVQLCVTVCAVRGTGGADLRSRNVDQGRVTFELT